MTALYQSRLSTSRPMEGRLMQHQDITIAVGSCRRCGQIRPENQFPKQYKAKLGRSRVCLDCQYAKKKVKWGKRITADGMKLCRQCTTLKPLQEFNLQKKSLRRDGSASVNTICKPCAAIANKRFIENRKKKPTIEPTNKQCRTCGEVKAIGHFYVNKSTADWREIHCIPCAREKTKSDTDLQYKNKKWYCMRKYGISIENLHEMLADQGFSCAICGSSIELFSGIKGPREAHIDHCHSTGVVRGILCRVCNPRVGVVEVPGFLEKALAYLGKYR